MTMKDAFTIHSSALPGSTQLAGFHGSEGLSRLYSFELYLVMTNDVGHDFSLESAVGSQATISLERSHGNPPFAVNGILATIELVSDFAGRSVFRAVLVPRLWHLTQSLHSRVFTQQTLPAILEAVLQRGGLSGSDYSLRLLGSYATQEHVCQYQESDYDFISRWMEREGLYYYFEQGEGVEKLIITDDGSSHKPLANRPIRYFPQSEGMSTHGDAFRAFTCRHTALPASVRLKDYDYAKPMFDVSGQAAVSPTGVGQISVHGGRFFSPAEGAHLAQVKAQGLQSGSVVYQGFGAAPNLRPGYTFELEEHPRAAFNTKYLTTELEHWGNQLPGLPELKQLIPWDEWYRVEVTAVAATVQYRAPQRTPWPRIYGTEHAVIDGPATSEYAQIDSHGRYAVKFHFDESDLTAGKASTWVRMLQPHGGGIEGFHFPLRAGTEVMCTFAGGDPDRPSIVGVAPNALTPSPVTAGNNTRNVLQTGGRNRFELEDKAGQERITLSTPHSNSYIRMGAPNAGHMWIASTDGNALHDIGGALDIHVKATKTEQVQGAVTEEYFDTKSEYVKGNVTNEYGAAMSETIGTSLTQGIGTTLTQVVGQPTGKKTADDAFSAGTTLSQEIYGHHEVFIDGHYKRTATMSLDVVKGDTSSRIDGTSTSKVYGTRYSYTKGLQESHVLGGVLSTVVGGTVSTVVGGQLSTVEGLAVSNVLGGSVSATEIAALNVVAGVRTNVTAGVQFNFNFGATTSTVTGISTGLFQGGKAEIVTGFKVELINGFAFKRETVKINSGITVMTQAEMELKTQQINIIARNLGLTVADVETFV
jgi:type VI secretion system secreted protein VgrG